MFSGQKVELVDQTFCDSVLVYICSTLPLLRYLVIKRFEGHTDPRWADSADCLFGPFLGAFYSDSICDFLISWIAHMSPSVSLFLIPLESFIQQMLTEQLPNTTCWFGHLLPWLQSCSPEAEPVLRRWWEPGLSAWHSNHLPSPPWAICDCHEQYSSNSLSVGCIVLGGLLGTLWCMFTSLTDFLVNCKHKMKNFIKWTCLLFRLNPVLTFTMWKIVFQFKMDFLIVWNIPCIHFLQQCNLLKSYIEAGHSGTCL